MLSYSLSDLAVVPVPVASLALFSLRVHMTIFILKQMESSYSNSIYICIDIRNNYVQLLAVECLSPCPPPL